MVDDVARFRVVRNDEDQYSIWPEDHEPPLGWHDSGYAGSREECIGHIDTVWTDMRPRSLREATETDSGVPT